MTLGKIIKQYREDRGMSMREFENISGISRGYLSMLEKDENPQSKKSIAPSLNIIKKAAFAMGASVDDILGRMDGENVTLSGENSISVSDEEMEVIMAYRRADDVTRIMVQRSLGIEELLEYKTRNTPPNENLEILRKKA